MASFSKARTNTFYIFRQCTFIVYLRRLRQRIQVASVNIAPTLNKIAPTLHEEIHLILKSSYVQ
jgi:hypothetical protein